MPFTLKKRESYRWTVEHVVAVIGGAPQKISFDMEFRALPQKRVDELLQAAARLEVKDQDLFGELVLGWHDMKDGRGEQEQTLEFTAANLQALFEAYPGIQRSISRAWTESVLGGAVRKN